MRTFFYCRRRLFCPNFVGCFPHLLRKILSSSHFKCSKAIAILIRDKDWMRTANQTSQNKRTHTHRPCPLWIMLLSYFDRRDIFTTFLYTSWILIYITPPLQLNSCVKKFIDKIIIRVNDCTCQMKWGKLRVFLSERSHRSSSSSSFHIQKWTIYIHRVCDLCEFVAAKKRRAIFNRLKKNFWSWGPEPLPSSQPGTKFIHELIYYRSCIYIKWI